MVSDFSPVNSIAHLNVDPVPVKLDGETSSFYLRIENANQIVLLQALIESYEGVGTVRTVDISESLVAVLAPKDQVNDCQRLLSSLQKEIPYRCVAADFQQRGAEHE